MIRFLTFIAITLTLALPAFAELKSPPGRASEPVKIKSDTLTADNNKKSATFTGNVIARQGDLTIFSDKLVVTYSEESSEMGSAEATGNVRLTQGERRAEADHAVYDAQKGVILLDGNPKVFQGNDRISGKTITYYLDQEKSEVSSGTGSRVEAVIHPKRTSSDGQQKGK